MVVENPCRNLFVLTSNNGFGMIEGLMEQIYQSNKDFRRLELKFLIKQELDLVIY